MEVGVRARLGLVTACVLGLATTAFAQAPTITARTPSRGSTSGGATVEVLVNGWLVTGGAPTTVTVGGAGGPVTNLVVQPPNRLTFVTPARPAGPVTIIVASGANKATTSFTYVAPVARSISGARRPIFSYTGRFVAFESRYALVPQDTNGVSDIYVRDRTTNTVRRVSISTTGAQAIGGESTHPSISGNGRFVAFQSRAANLVPGDTNGLIDVLLHDRDADGNGTFDLVGAADRVSTVRVSIFPSRPNPSGQAQGGDSTDPAISGDGRFVSFTSSATNLALGDTLGFSDVFVFNRLSGSLRRVSTNANGVFGDSDSRNPAMSLDGRFVAFESLANNIAGGNGTPQAPLFDIFLHDRDADREGPNGVFDEPGGIETQLVSVNRCEANLTNHAVDPSITHDGRFIVYVTRAGNAKMSQDCRTVLDTNGANDIFIYDRLDGTTLRRLSEGANGLQFIADSGSPFISGNGQLLVFATEDANAGGTGTVTAAVGVHEEANDGKSTTGVIPSPTDDTPPPPDVEPPPPTQSTEDPTASGDGSNTGNTSQPTPGTGGGEPVVDTVETPVPQGENDTPFIAALSPSSGPSGVATFPVEIHGGNFASVSAVTWNGANFAFNVVTESLIRVPNPPDFATGTEVPVRVIAGGKASNAVTFTYVAGLSAPDISSLSATSGSVAGGTPVTISGSGFSAPSVAFGPVTATITGTPTANLITVTAPAQAVAGPVPVVVRNGDGATAVSDGPFTYTMAAPVSAPVVASLLPATGPETGGTAVTITGQQFAPGATVTFNGVPATDVQVLGNTQIVAISPAGAQGPADVIVTVGANVSPAQVFQYEPLAPPVLTCTGTDSDGDTMSDAWEVQYGLAPADPTDAALDLDADGRTNAQECQELSHPRGHYTRFLAEGATGMFFNTRIVVANPNLAPARVLFRFLTGSGFVVRRFQTVPSNSRRTIDLQLLAGLEAVDVSSVVESDTEIVVDRTMRWGFTSRFGSHAEASVSALSLQWYLAEGATTGDFSLFYLIQNPSQTVPAQVRIRFLLPTGPPLERVYDVAPNTRFTLRVHEIPELAETEVSAVIDSLNGVPVIVERAMYSSAAGTFAAGHDSAGVTAPSLQWFFAEGATGTFFDLFLLLANPEAVDAAVSATYLLPGGGTVSKSYTVAANSRRTINVQLEDPALADTAVSMSLQSTNGVPIIAERAMWWPHVQPWHEAHNSAGSTVTGTRWGLADGERGAGDEDTQTYILVANTSAAAAALRVTLLLESGAPLVREYTVPGNSRFNVPVGDHFALAPGTRFSAVVETTNAVPIVVERAMYWNADGIIWAAGSNLLATKLQ